MSKNTRVVFGAVIALLLLILAPRIEFHSDVPSASAQGQGQIIGDGMGMASTALTLDEIKQESSGFDLQRVTKWMLRPGICFLVQCGHLDDLSITVVNAGPGRSQQALEEHIQRLVNQGDAEPISCSEQPVTPGSCSSR